MYLSERLHVLLKMYISPIWLSIFTDFFLFLLVLIAEITIANFGQNESVRFWIWIQP